MATIERVPYDFAAKPRCPDGKRCYVPGYVIRDNCPTCGRACVFDLSQSYVGSPALGLTTAAFLDCPSSEDGGCGSEWKVEIVVELSVKLAEGA